VSLKKGAKVGVETFKKEMGENEQQEHAKEYFIIVYPL